MYEKQGLLQQYNKDEIKQLLKDKTKLVYIDNGSEEFVARYEDLPDIIVDINEKLGHTENFKVYDYDNPDINYPMLTTMGYFLNRCNPDVRRDIIDRLTSLQLGEEEIKEYKVIDEDVLDDVRYSIINDEMER